MVMTADITLNRRSFVFLRHGETDANREGIIAGRTEAMLTDLGRQQSGLAAERLAGFACDCVASSPQKRALETAGIALPGQPLIHLDSLRERDWGALEGQPLGWLVPYEETPPDGETWEAFRCRVIGGLNWLTGLYPCPVVVAHSGVFRVIRSEITGTPHGPRIGNAEPVYIQAPATDGAAWSMNKL